MLYEVITDETTVTCNRGNNHRLLKCLKAANVVDIGFSWRRLMGAREALFSIRMDNAFDTKYRTMPGMPELGRMITTRWQYSF